MDVSRGMAGPDCESGGERSAAARLWMEACMGVAGLGRASSGNISSSSADECICESPSTSEGGEGVVSSRFGRLRAGGGVDMVVRGRCWRDWGMNGLPDMAEGVRLMCGSEGCLFVV